jgi:signal transduction histidine kinase
MNAAPAIPRGQTGPLVDEGTKRFAATLAHELRTPLVGILGFSELLLDDAASGQSVPATVVAEHADLIRRSGERLLELTRRCELWLDLNTRYSTAADLDREGWQDDQWMSAVTQEVRQVAHAAARAHDVTLACAPAALALPGGLLGPVLRQLVDNACKFSQPGDPVTVNGTFVDAFHYAFTVTDTGRGFPMERREHIAAFVQFDRDRHEQQGLGLGLAIVRRFAELVDGSLTLEPGPQGRGTCVRLTLPRVPRGVAPHTVGTETSAVA